MRTLKITILALACALLAFGQASMTSTTLSAAMDATQRFAIVASATGVTAPANMISGEPGNPSGTGVVLLYVDREAMRVNAVNSTTATVQRGVQGTLATAHASGAKVWVGPTSYYAMIDPIKATPCTSSLLTVLPRVVIPTGRLWTCGNSLWTTFDNDVFTVGATLAVSTAGTTLVPTNPVHHVSGTSNVVYQITIPAAMPYTGGCISLIPDAIFATSASGGNIALGSTAVVSKVLRMCLQGTLWYPSY